jgi:hypothetical protein
VTSCPITSLMFDAYLPLLGVLACPRASATFASSAVAPPEGTVPSGAALASGAPLPVSDRRLSVSMLTAVLSCRFSALPALPVVPSFASDMLLNAFKRAYADPSLSSPLPSLLLHSTLPASASRFVLWTGRVALVCASVDAAGPGRCGILADVPVVVIPPVCRSAYTDNDASGLAAAWRRCESAVYVQRRQAALMSGLAYKFSLQARDVVVPVNGENGSVSPALSSRRIAWLPDTGPKGYGDRPSASQLRSFHVPQCA